MSWTRSAAALRAERRSLDHHNQPTRAASCAGRRENGLAFRRHQARLSRVTNGVRSDPAGWTDERQKRGLAGEEQAIQYLLSRGWRIVAHRFRVGHTEIDLIARQGSLVAFVEVKARRGDAFGSPLQAVTGAERPAAVQPRRGMAEGAGPPA